MSYSSKQQPARLETRMAMIADDFGLLPTNPADYDYDRFVNERAEETVALATGLPEEEQIVPKIGENLEAHLILRYLRFGETDRLAYLGGGLPPFALPAKKASPNLHTLRYDFK